MEQKLKRLWEESAGILNTTAYFMNRAEQYLAQGNTDSARACLVLLCEKVENYEESLEWNGLMDSWLKHRHLVEGLVKPSYPFNSVQPLRPWKCTKQIQDILSLPEDDILLNLSDHLRELSANGSALTFLNKWERTVYYADELLVELNSGGLHSYLYYHGEHFEKAYQAMAVIAATGVLSILDAVRDQFPRKRIPKSEEARQNILDNMMDLDLYFDNEDNRFYSSGEKELLTRLLAYVLENGKRFR